ncbi:MAG: type II toxin-antitoxin system RelE/ParE family toxin [Bacteroidaceae bacterium]|nr:type II toxin-antitoxin system RelE/ParE family toxin [Bacteroidaceae bacterium]
MEIIWAEEAFRAWQDTIDYIVKEFGVRAAEKFYKKTEEWQDVLSSSPMVGKIEPLLNNRSRSYRSIVITKQNKLIYYIEDETIFIVDFWDTRREPLQQADKLK